MEKSIVTTFLVGCITLGFFCLFSVYLPTQLKRSQGTLPVTTISVNASPTLTDVINQLSPLPQGPEKLPAAMAFPTNEESNADEEMNSMMMEDFDDNAGEEIYYAGSKTHRSKISKSKRVSKKARPVKAVPPEVANQYPLRIYEPLEEALSRRYGHGFVVTESLRAPFEFWRNVYARYDFNRSVLHDNRYLDIVYGVLDFSKLDENLTLSKEEKRAIRQGVEERKKQELRTMLLRFDNGESPKTAGEHIVYRFFEKSSDPNKFRKAAERVRSQWGQRDRFMAGLTRSGRYMPLMEEIFIREGVPKEMTRLVFVESMFTLNAISKVAAGGPWQFMPGTARGYMTMNEYVDERRDPLIAAQAAARLLLKNYSHVGSWPLAVNGYNTGILRMVKAMQRLGTRDIGTIIHRFEDSGYQFASRNFYPEFLAALEVADHYRGYFGNLEMQEPIPFDEIILPYNTSLPKLADTTGTDVNVLKDLNPAYNERSFLSQTVVPRGYIVRVPHQQKVAFLTALNTIQAEERSAKWHMVGKGESLKNIANRYQIPITLLKAANGLLSHQIKQGQILKIPSAPTEVVLETR
ncbi:MAG: hypothetical protein A3F82_00770 [Deltaproteobacteria bacterium RIFCSPLOWO2_12_FULL_44_12]|nr:MAG: hypothetical protein A3D98_08835 [Deltaproteobacteria bacterium RIFCSPHIGHO2_12_FULL_44_21]OGQ32902.1 MAG: hypothetical protein A2979_10085 [Deltaproteobacteria bacterium RIFCSPLOWO2_01_FULL_45_74]OGQ71528.1 MAG: hypothetical protein A3F82_00770 [Deltaproteobacteria bacterium RIFCSPLOWO2_12_FULL_44_12]